MVFIKIRIFFMSICIWKKSFLIWNVPRIRVFGSLQFMSIHQSPGHSVQIISIIKLPFRMFPNIFTMLSIKERLSKLLPFCLIFEVFFNHLNFEYCTEVFEAKLRIVKSVKLPIQDWLFMLVTSIWLAIS